MSTADQIREDLQYVKGAVQRQKRGYMPLGIALVWAGFVLVGFTGLDIRPDWAAIFLLVGGPVAYLISSKIGYGSALSAGINDRAEMRRQALHWGSLFLAIAALVVLAAEGRLSGETLGQTILIVVGLVYLLAGVHLQMRLFYWLGPLMMVGAVAVTYIDRWGWTTVGVLTAVGILACSIVSRRNG